MGKTKSTAPVAIAFSGMPLYFAVLGFLGQGLAARLSYCLHARRAVGGRAGKNNRHSEGLAIMRERGEEGIDGKVVT